MKAAGAALAFAAGPWASGYPLITIGLRFSRAFSFAALRPLLAALDRCELRLELALGKAILLAL